MRALAAKLVWVAVFFTTLIPVIGILRGEEWRLMVLTGLFLAFATISVSLRVGPPSLILAAVPALGEGSAVRPKCPLPR
jgi:hypothetical protein